MNESPIFDQSRTLGAFTTPRSTENKDDFDLVIGEHRLGAIHQFLCCVWLLVPLLALFRVDGIFDLINNAHCLIFGLFTANPVVVPVESEDSQTVFVVH